jgi:hypothetical protein
MFTAAAVQANAVPPSSVMGSRKRPGARLETTGPTCHNADGPPCRRLGDRQCTRRQRKPRGCSQGLRDQMKERLVS